MKNNKTPKGTFQEQLERASTHLFNLDPPSESNEIIKEIEEIESKEPESKGVPGLNYPIQENKFWVDDFPASFLHRYWAGYSTRYREEWYRESHGPIGPLKKLGISTSRFINVQIFNFSFLALTIPLYNLFNWVIKHVHPIKIPTKYSLLDSCKMYANISMSESVDIASGRPFKPSRRLLARLFSFHGEIARMSKIVDFDGLNGYYPMVEPCDELYSVDNDTFVIYGTARFSNVLGRYVYPLIPSGLYGSSKFSIKNWDFIDPK